MLAYGTSAVAQIEAKVIQSISIRGTGWKKVISTGTPVTIFAYKHHEEIYTFGIYSDDYAGIIDFKIYPFDIEEKQLKKLPNAKGKNVSQELLPLYYNKARTKAREKAFAGEYKTIAPVTLHPNGYSISSVIKNDSITIIGFKQLYDNLFERPFYRFAIVNNDCADFFENYSSDNIEIDMPLAFLPSTDDAHVKSLIDNGKRRIVARREAEKKAREEEERQKKIREEKERAETQARLDSINKVIQEEKLANLRTLSPAFIEMRGWNMDSAGGIAVDMRFTNCSSQKVKYVYFKGYFLNAVGDKCRNDINGSTEWKYRGVGPISPLPNTPEEMGYAHVESWHFGNPLFYSTIAVKFRLSSVTIEYMNGKKTVLSGAELNKRVAYVY